MTATVTLPAFVGALDTARAHLHTLIDDVTAAAEAAGRASATMDLAGGIPSVAAAAAREYADATARQVTADAVLRAALVDVLDVDPVTRQDARPARVLDAVTAWESRTVVDDLAAERVAVATDPSPEDITVGSVR